MPHNDQSEYPKGIWHDDFNSVGGSVSFSPGWQRVRVSHFWVTNMSGGTHICALEDGAGNRIATTKPAPGETHFVDLGIEVVGSIQMIDDSGATDTKNFTVVYYDE